MRVHLNSPIKRISRTADGWRVETLHSPARQSSFDGVIVALPAPAASAVLTSANAQLAKELQRIEYAGCAVISLGFARQQIQHPLNGFGFVVPRKAPDHCRQFRQPEIHRSGTHRPHPRSRVHRRRDAARVAETIGRGAFGNRSLRVTRSAWHPRPAIDSRRRPVAAFNAAVSRRSFEPGGAYRGAIARSPRLRAGRKRLSRGWHSAVYCQREGGSRSSSCWAAKKRGFGNLSGYSPVEAPPKSCQHSCQCG